MTRDGLGCFFAPRRVAVIGATGRPGSVGRAVMENLRDFPGEVWPINPRRARVLGRPAMARIGDIGARVDLAIVATPAAVVTEVIGECAAAGVRGAVVLSAGFGEAGEAGLRRQEEMLAVARGAVRIIGPNCLGVMGPAAGLNATFAGVAARPGGVAFLSQSGALGTAILDWSLRENVGFSGFVSVGCMADVGWPELIAHFGNDARTRCLALYLESIGDVGAFLAAARKAARAKPIIALKPGRTKAASRAAASHTGALTGDDAVVDALFRRAGVTRVETIEELFDMAEALEKQPRPRGPRLAVVTNAGGPAALAADAATLAGASLATLSPRTLRALERALPSHWSRGNPVDLLGDADPGRYARALAIVAADPGIDGVLAILTPQAMTDATAVAERIVRLGRLPRGMPLLASWMGGAAVDAGEAALNAAGVPTFRQPERAARTFARMWRHAEVVAGLRESSGAGAWEGRAGRARGVNRILETARAEGRTLLTEAEAKRVLALYGIPTTRTETARSEVEAVAIARRIGFPVVAKLWSETITHKKAVGGVRLGLRTAGDVRAAWRGIRRAVAGSGGCAGDFLGVTVQPEVERGGCEVILGCACDAQAGPVILFGAGGEFVEAWRDCALELPPLNARLARRLMERTRVHVAVERCAGGAAVERALVALSRLVVEQPRIREIDVNPLRVADGRVVALDARMTLHPWAMADAELPRAALARRQWAASVGQMLRSGGMAKG